MLGLLALLSAILSFINSLCLIQIPEIRLDISAIEAIADTAVKEFDKNGDGVISKDEFEMFKIKYFYDSEKWQRWLDKKFTKFDSDKDGNLNTSEFKSLINRMLRR